MIPKDRPKIVAIGGGTGLASVLRGLKEHACELTAIVTVADNGGSSGRLRRDMGMLPPGDIRNCILALAEAEPAMAELFNHRFSRGSLEGHVFGNLFIAAMTEMTGDFQLAVRTLSRVLAVRGAVMPSTLHDVNLRAFMEDGSVIEGEANIPEARGQVARLELVPPDPPALYEAVEAVREADTVIIGPGSLYTSIIPNLLVPGIRQAVMSSRASRLYVCNIMTQPGETDSYTVTDHVEAIEKHAGRLFDWILANTGRAPGDISAKYAEEGRYEVKVCRAELRKKGYSVLTGDYLSRGDLARHDSAKLASAVLAFTQGVKKERRKLGNQ